MTTRPDSPGAGATEGGYAMRATSLKAILMASAVGGLALAAAGQASAQATAQASDKVDEIVVTAFKQGAQAVQDVPSSIAVLGGERLEKMGVSNFADFAHAVAGTPELGAAVVYYGTPPEADQLSKVHAPVLGLYGQNDARTTSTVPGADSALKALSKTFEHFVFDSAGHGFLRAQDGHNGANAAAAEQAWPKTIAWFGKYLRS